MLYKLMPRALQFDIRRFQISRLHFWTFITARGTVWSLKINSPKIEEMNLNL